MAGTVGPADPEQPPPQFWAYPLDKGNPEYCGKGLVAAVEALGMDDDYTKVGTRSANGRVDDKGVFLVTALDDEPVILVIEIDAGGSHHVLRAVGEALRNHT